ncbi:MAG TPA: cysteine--tRNA ligase [Solirubrobacteraceae bacterium]|nr:cysteine--tRNA ligase [Solirubrobacteraceae bacterium]
MREITLQDTRSGRVSPLGAGAEDEVGIYVCGPTVYDRIHLGNARPYVVFSVLKRFLIHEGYRVRLVMNITDINDKIYDAARRRAQAGEAIDSVSLAREMTERYRADTDALGLGRPDVEPLASESIAAIISYIERLIELGHAYAVPIAGAQDARADVYFHVRSDAAYGSLSHRRIEEMDQGEGVEGAERKRDPLDFALWKARKEGEDSAWGSPWGEGRPGWHIECSAMAEAALGVGFAIHGGGADLIFPHHENEAAQSRCAHEQEGAELARLWVHNGMVQMTGEKMAKSLGNIAPLHEVIGAFGAHATILFLLSGHYRQPLLYSPQALRDAELGIARIREALRRLQAGRASPQAMAPIRAGFFAALAEDFNTPRALAALFGWVREANRRAVAGEEVGDEDLREMLDVLGLDVQPLESARDPLAGDPELAVLLEERERARAARDYARADQLREEIRERGWVLRDGPGGPELIARASEGPGGQAPD